MEEEKDQSYKQDQNNRDSNKNENYNIEHKTQYQNQKQNSEDQTEQMSIEKFNTQDNLKSNGHIYSDNKIYDDQKNKPLQFDDQNEKIKESQKMQQPLSELKEDKMNPQQSNIKGNPEQMNLNKNDQDILDQDRIFKTIMSKFNEKNQALVNYPNVLFYAGKLRSNYGKGEHINEILARYENYKKLEYDHAYIQWIFPNKYKSNFNNLSTPLSDAEIEFFLKERLIAYRYVESYKMMLNFYGIRIKNLKTGELERNLNYQERYEDAICGHNVLRIRRILTSLNNVGFRRYAIQLCNFLKKEIQEGQRPLKRRNGDYNCDWKMYGEYEEEDEYDKRSLEKNCFQNIEQIKRVNIYLQDQDENNIQI